MAECGGAFGGGVPVEVEVESVDADVGVVGGGEPGEPVGCREAEAGGSNVGVGDGEAEGDVGG